MEFRPCIDIHNGKVKQIVGSSLRDEGDFAKENFVSEKDSTYYAKLYKSYGLSGGHVILLNQKDSDYYEATKREAINALKAYPGGLMVGGGIDDNNCKEFINAGASHVIVTSFVFKDGSINMENLNRLVDAVGKDKICLDLSCRRKGDTYFVVTDRWQKFTKTRFDQQLFEDLSDYCSEFLIHAVDSEGKSQGIDKFVLDVLSNIKDNVTYAGGISSYEDIRVIREIGRSNVHFTVGSKLDIFGGSLTIGDILECIQ